jgi:hypothetical protein
MVEWGGNHGGWGGFGPSSYIVKKCPVEEEPRKAWKWNSSRQFLLISRAKLGQQL